MGHSWRRPRLRGNAAERARPHLYADLRGLVQLPDVGVAVWTLAVAVWCVVWASPPSNDAHRRHTTPAHASPPHGRVWPRPSAHIHTESTTPDITRHTPAIPFRRTARGASDGCW